jgi:hypothetical protein
MVLIALLFSAVSLANEQDYLSVSLPLFVVIGLVAYASSEGTISTLITQRTGYVWHQKVIDVIRARISEKTSGTLDSEVEIFYDRKIFKPGTAWFNRVNFVILTGSALVILCAYLTLSGFSAIQPLWIPDSMTALVMILFVFVLSIQKMYHALIRGSCQRARNLFCQMQRYENPPTESREIKGLRRYSLYLLGTEILTLTCALFYFSASTLFIVIIAASAVILILTILTFISVRKEIVC